MHPDLARLEAGLDEVLASPRSEGTLNLIVARPSAGERRLLDAAELRIDSGLAGDNWSSRGSRLTGDGSAHPDLQVTLMNDRVASLVAQDPSRRLWAGDQLYVDFDLGEDNLPAGSELAVGEALLRISAIPHTGCKKFVERFGVDAMKWVNSKAGRRLRLRGVNARVLRGGRVAVGDVVRKVR